MPTIDSRAWLLVDLGYGDAAKGATVDYLARAEPVGTVVRFNGGPQAGHNVVTPDGRHHTFAQFGSGSFVPGAVTHLARHVLVNPLNAFREEAHLRAVGVRDAFERLVVHPDCLVITPYHVAANRLREIARGADRHGSCGMGIGETVADALACPEGALRAADLAAPTVVARRLEAARQRLRSALDDVLPRLDGTGAAGVELAIFSDPELVDRYADCARTYAARVALGDEDWLRARMRGGVTVFEPAQGTLIDEDHGFHPYTTWSRTTLANAEALLRATDFGGEVRRVGLVRAYATRHGAGPFVPDDAGMTARLPDRYNPPGDWQGAMRCGPFDFLATRYALGANPGVDRLAVSHLDLLDDPDCVANGWPFCRAYVHGGAAQPALAAYDAAGLVRDLRPAPAPDLAHQARLAELLTRCVPVVERVAPAEALDLIEHELARSVVLCAWGPTAADRAWRADLASGASAPHHPSWRSASAGPVLQHA